LLAFGEEEFLAALAITGSEAFFNKLLVAAPAFQSIADFVAAYSDKKKTIDDLTDKFVDKVGEAKRAQDDIIPHLAHMQSLLSKKGANHHLVIAARKQGHKIPWWTDYYESYRDRLWESLRTMERRIAKYRNDPTAPEPKPDRNAIPRLTKADRKRLVEASHRANELIAALEAGRDGKKEISDFKAVMDATRLDDIVQVQEREFEYLDLLDYPDPPTGASLKVWNDWAWGWHGSVQTVIDISKAHLRLRKNGFPYYKLKQEAKAGGASRTAPQRPRTHRGRRGYPDDGRAGILLVLPPAFVGGQVQWHAHTDRSFSRRGQALGGAGGACVVRKRAFAHRLRGAQGLEVSHRGAGRQRISTERRVGDLRPLLSRQRHCVRSERGLGRQDGWRSRLQDSPQVHRLRTRDQDVRGAEADESRSESVIAAARLASRDAQGRQRRLRAGAGHRGLRAVVAAVFRGQRHR